MAEKLASVRDIVELVPSVLQVAVDCVDPPSFDYRPGQFISLRCSEDGEKRRSYSISSHPSHRGGFELLVRQVPGGLGSSYLGALQKGSQLHFTGPMGFFVPELRHEGDAVFVATGAGIAAAYPMALDVASRAEETGRVVLYWGMRSQGDLYWLDRLDALAARSPRFRRELVLSQPDGAWPGPRGRVTDHVLRAVDDRAFDRPVYYLVGHGDMVRDVKAGLEQRGVDRRKRIRTEVFYPATKKSGG
jgi:NAD(P)H-flavin reductase